jgi:hypothetical protein
VLSNRCGVAEIGPGLEGGFSSILREACIDWRPPGQAIALDKDLSGLRGAFATHGTVGQGKSAKNAKTGGFWYGARNDDFAVGDF